MWWIIAGCLVAAAAVGVIVWFAATCGTPTVVHTTDDRLRLAGQVAVAGGNLYARRMGGEVIIDFWHHEEDDVNASKVVDAVVEGSGICESGEHVVVKDLVPTYRSRVDTSHSTSGHIVGPERGALAALILASPHPPVFDCDGDHVIVHVKNSASEETFKKSKELFSQFRIIGGWSEVR